MLSDGAIFLLIQNRSAAMVTQLSLIWNDRMFLLFFKKIISFNMKMKFNDYSRKIMLAGE